MILSYKHINTPLLLCSTTGRGSGQRADAILSTKQSLK